MNDEILCEKHLELMEKLLLTCKLEELRDFIIESIAYWNDALEYWRSRNEI